MARCLLVGFYDIDLVDHEQRVRAFGTDSAAYQDLSLSLVWHQGRPFRALDLINRLHPEGPRLHNADFLWPVVAILGTRLHRAGHSFDYINLPHLERDAFRTKLADPELLVVAITTTLYTQSQPIIELVAFVRKHRPTATIVVGGPHIAGLAAALAVGPMEEQLLYLGADIYVISAEGEQALCEVVDALDQGRPLDPVHNLAIRRKGGLVFTERSIEYNQLSESRVDYRLFSPEAFGQFVTTRTAKSCPFSCAFCGFPERAGRYTTMSVQEVGDELDAIAEIGGVSTLTIIDDTFNVPKGRFKALLRMMIERDYGFRWNSFYRSDHGDDETLELMAAAGCEGVILGVESGSDRMLGLMNKSARKAHYLHAIPRLESLGVSCYASLIVGFPGETRESVEQTCELIETARPSYFRAQLWYCDPITPIYRDRERHGLRGEGFAWVHDTMEVDEACDHIEHMFLSIEGSTWQQQAGFELWSTFYLQRKGMSGAQVRAFLRSYNASIKERLLRPRSAHEIAPARLEELRRTSTLGLELPTDTDAPRLSGAEFQAAEAHWLEALGTEPIPTITQSDRTPSSVALDSGQDPTALIAALGLCTARLGGGWRAIVLAPGAPGLELLPILVDAGPTLTWAALLERVQGEYAHARQHREFGLPLLRGRLLERAKARTPTIEAAFSADPRALQTTLAEYPPLEQELRITLVQDNPRGPRLRAWLGLDAASRLATTIGALLAEHGPQRLDSLGSLDEVQPRVEPEFCF